MQELKSYLNEVIISTKKTSLKRIKVVSSACVAEYTRQLLPVDINYRECMIALLLNRSNNVISYFVVGIGTDCGVHVNATFIFQAAIKCNASAVIMVHNHPSGGTKPSGSDERTTLDMVKIRKNFKNSCIGSCYYY